MAQLEELKVVILDGACIERATGDGDGADRLPIGSVCPRVVELDLSRNLFTRIGVVSAICRELDSLRSLRLKWVSSPPRLRPASPADLPTVSFFSKREPVP